MVLELRPRCNSDELHRDVTSQNAPGPRSLQTETRRKTNMAAAQVTFRNPTGVAASNAEVFVADPTSGHEKITVFNLMLQPVRDFPTVVQDGRKIRPEDVALDGKGNLWVVGTTTPDAIATTCEFAVQYTTDGSYVRQIDLPKSALAKGIAVDTTSNHILVTQSMFRKLSSNYPPSPPRSFIGVYREDGTQVLERSVQQTEGTRLNQQYLAVAPNGNILVSDEAKNCISVYNGPFAEFGGVGSGAGQLNDPRGICTDGAGNVIVADRGNARVVVFDNNGKFCKNLVANLNIAPEAVAVTLSRTGQVKLVVTSALHNKVAILDL